MNPSITPGTALPDHEFVNFVRNVPFGARRALTFDCRALGGGLWLLSGRSEEVDMHAFNVVVERDGETGLYVGSVPGWAGAHTQAATLDELQANLQEVLEMLLEDGEPQIESEFVGIQTVRVA